MSGTTTGFLLEEEKCSSYDPESYYPARIGETIRGKYRLISKLGWGTGSTVWLAGTVSRWPWKTHRYVALKITNSSSEVQAAARKEIEISKHMCSMWTTHPGQEYVRKVLDSFEIEGRGRTHLCLALEPLRQPLWMIGRQTSANGFVQPRIIKALLPGILKCLDFLHTECHVIHTDLKGDHFMLPFEDPAVLNDYVREQEANPAPFEERRGRPVYESRPDFGRFRKGVGFVKLTDFGLAVRGDVSTKYFHDIQPLEYTAPEVMLQAGWSYSADIWNLGLVLWELMAETNILDGKSSVNQRFSYLTRFAQMIRLLGPPPASLLSRADKDVYSRLYDSQGMSEAEEWSFRYPDLIPGEDFNFCNKTTMLDGQDKALFIQFAKRMLAWMPEDRSTARELLDDPWLKLSMDPKEKCPK
ncbi:protein kinase domain protein [Metarhizium rileyi]|uniref:non-specific serine/threonine protein kinase n=1 Tax=Metarhizium rileyi (strain RCEF 4871) TaxID=1649241 RepID=A0A167JK02_METRR|nr:protein kinase domain protein [Metarhizium rileyi RCEF 4871]